MKENKRLLIGLFIRPGLHRFADSEINFARAMYVVSHPWAVLVVAYYLLLLAVPSVPQIHLGFWGGAYSAFVASYADGEMGYYIQRFFSFYPIASLSLVVTMALRLVYAEEKHWLQRWNGKTIAWHVKAILGFGLIGTVAFLGMFIPGDPSFCSGCTTKSVGGLFFIYGIGLPIGFAVLAACIWCLSKRVVAAAINVLLKQERNNG